VGVGQEGIAADKGQHDAAEDERHHDGPQRDQRWQPARHLLDAGLDLDLEGQ
jgi:hypothetical protein